MLTRTVEEPTILPQVRQVLRRKEMCGFVQVRGSQKSVIPLVVLSSGEVPSTEQLVQQLSHMLTSNGTAFQRGLDAMPHKDEKQGGRGQLLHTLHCLLQGAQGTGGREQSDSRPDPTMYTRQHSLCPHYRHSDPSHYQPSCR